MTRGFHPGELAVQERAGVRDRAARVGGSVHGAVPAAAKPFLEQRNFVVLATAGTDGRPWASILTGAPGFASAPDPFELRIVAQPAPGDPLAETLTSSRFAGLLAIDLAARRRMRVNGRLEQRAGGPIVIRVDQAYSNCPKYIQRRTAEDATLHEDATLPGMSRLMGRTRSLTEEQRAWIRRADTFFIATTNPGEGADASHRGGMPGFIAVEGDRLVWPDYAGNMMYNTLGNIAVHPWAGLLVPDFASGAMLQLTGRAAIDWDSARTVDLPGAERLVELAVEEVVEIAGVLPPWPLIDYSPFTPPVEGAVGRTENPAEASRS